MKEIFEILDNFIESCEPTLIVAQVMIMLTSFIMEKFISKKKKRDKKFIRLERVIRYKKHKLIYKKIVETKENKLINEKKGNLIEELVKNKSQKNSKILLLLVLINICNYILNLKIPNLNSKIISLFLTVTFGLIAFYNILIIYRSRKGYYGTNYDEAKEILYFIKQNNNDINKGKKIFNDFNDIVVNEMPIADMETQH